VSLLLLAVAGRGQAQDDYTLFVADFQKAQQFKDDKLLDRALQTRARWALEFYCTLAREWRNAPPDVSDKARAQMDVLLEAWKRVFKTSTLDKIERYYASADHTTLKQLDTNQTALYVSHKNLVAARSARRRLDLEAAKDTLWKLAETYERLGHNLKAAEAWECVAEALNSLPDMTVNERRDAVFALERYKEVREGWEFTDEPLYKKNLSWLKATKDELASAEQKAKEREAKGVSGEAKGPDAVVDPKGAEVIADLTFEAMKADIEDCFVGGGLVMPNWQVVRLEGETPKQLLYFQASQLFAARIGGKYYIGPTAEDIAAKGTVISPATKPKPQQFWLDDKKTKPYAMWFFVGSDKEPFMGLEQNLAPSAEAVLLYYKSAASYRAHVGSEDVVFYDSNADGKLMTPDPYAFGMSSKTVDIGNDVAIPGYDAMQIGKKGSIQPFSSYAKIGEQWFHLRAAKEGTAVSARPVIPEFLKTGTLHMKWTGPKTTTVQCLVVRGEADLGIAAFNLASLKPIEVPAGMYVVDFGRVAEGKGGSLQTADIYRGKSEAITVKAGETTVLTIGAPFTFDFDKASSGADSEINAHKIKVLGASKEHYANLNNCVPEIEVLFAKDAKGKGAKPVGTFIAVPDIDTLNKLVVDFKEIGYQCPLFPIVKGAKERLTILRFTPPGDGFVSLRAPKAKLFGKIESGWK
jgi:hypothetical protein